MSTSENSPVIISVKHLKKSFGNLDVLIDINAEIRKGEVITVIGPSGTGKSTFLRCLNLLETPDSGEILIDGEDLLAPTTDINKLRQKIGMVFQSFNLFSHLMVVENVMLGPIKLKGMERQKAYDLAMEYLAQVGLASKAKAYPDEISGGQKQRVAIARTLAMKPEIILFDEPTSALDPTMISEVLGVIRRLAEDGQTLMIVTHEMRFAHDVSTRVFYMDEGVIYEEGTPEQVFDNPQKEKTHDFVNKIRSLDVEMDNENNDLFEFNTRLCEFCRHHFIENRFLEAIQYITEELIRVNIFADYENNLQLKMSIDYSELTNEVDFTIRYKGAPKDYMKDPDPDENPGLIKLPTYINHYSYKYENGENVVMIDV